MTNFSIPPSTRRITRASAAATSSAPEGTPGSASRARESNTPLSARAQRAAARDERRTQQAEAAPSAKRRRIAAPSRSDSRAAPGLTPATWKDALPLPTFSPGQLMAHLKAQRWFEKRKVSTVELVSARELSVRSEKGERLLLLGADVQIEGKDRKKRWLVPVALDAKGQLSDGLASQVMKDALIEQAGQGHRRIALHDPVDPELYAAVPRPGYLTPVIRPVEAKETEIAQIRAAFSGADNRWSALVASKLTSPSRFEHVVDQARILSPKNPDAFVEIFYKVLMETLDAQSPKVRAHHEKMKLEDPRKPVFYGYYNLMGTAPGKSNTTFYDLGMLEQVKKMGFQAIELLPIYESPGRDCGYDVTDHLQVAANLGGNDAFAKFMDKCVDEGLMVTGDIVANHVSDQHASVQALKAGRTEHLAEFIDWTAAEKIGTRDPGTGDPWNVILHMKGKHAGKISHVCRPFPFQNPDTFTELELNSEHYKLYSAFMKEFQLDTNIRNPKIAEYFLRVIGQLANHGQSVFRIDAAALLGKEPGTTNVNLPTSHAFMALLKAFAADAAPGSRFLPEVNLDPTNGGAAQGVADWLKPKGIFDNRLENTMGDVLLGFDAHAAIWTSLLTETKHRWMQAQEALGGFESNLQPGGDAAHFGATENALTYLTGHDETYIEDPDVRKRLIANGKMAFSGHGVGDSAAELLDNDPQRIALAHKLLFMTRQIPMVYYRNPVGGKNDQQFFAMQADIRKKAAGSDPDAGKPDPRDLDRGEIKLSQYQDAMPSPESAGYEPMAAIIGLNKIWAHHPSVKTSQVESVDNDEETVVSLARRAEAGGAPSLLNLANLSKAHKSVEFSMGELRAKLNWANPRKLRDLLQTEIDGKESHMAFKIDGDKLTIELPPLAGVWLEAEEEPVRL